jgi:hypothetical protein
MAVTLAERLLAYVREDRTLTVRVHVVDRAEALVQREHPNVGRCTPAKSRRQACVNVGIGSLIEKRSFTQMGRT